MQALFDDLAGRLSGFLAQREAAFLIASCAELETVIVLSTLMGIAETGNDVVFVCSTPFREPSSWVSGIVEEMRVQLDALAAVAAANDEPPVAPMPASLFDARVAPVARLRALFEHMRGLIEDPESAHLVIGLLPPEIADPRRYAEFILEFATHGFPIPWFHHMRFVVREDAKNPMLHQHARTMARTAWYAPDFGPKALENALTDEAKDEASPLPKRLQALFILAGMDVAYDRCPDALSKLAILIRYYEGTKNKPLLAQALNMVGETYVRANQPALALASFKKALIPALESLDAQALINITSNLAQLHRNQQRWLEAREHYEALGALAEARCNAGLRILAHEQSGLCAYKAGNPRGAHDSWRAAVALARGTGELDALLTCLDRIRGLYVEARAQTQLREVEDEMRALERQGAKRRVST